jgi:hypothetical protein
VEKALLTAIASSDVREAYAALDARLHSGEEPWNVHLSLFPAAQRVLNPPFINPHFPKLYRICRELPLERAEWAGLVRLEVGEYTLRPKLEVPPRPAEFPGHCFGDFEAAVARRAPAEAAALLASLWEREGGPSVARKLLLLGSGYVRETLGHSLSCTSFILLELLDRPEEDPWPTLFALAEYCCRGGFAATPPPERWEGAPAEPARGDVLRAASGEGLVALHDLLTLYGIERSKHLLDDGARRRLYGAWSEYLGDKPCSPVQAAVPASGEEELSAAVQNFQPEEAALAAAGLLAAEDGRVRLGRLVVRVLAEWHRAKANPHNVTGLGCLLWLLDRWRDDPEIRATALRQYFGYLLPELRVKPYGVSTQPPAQNLR